MAEEFAFKQLGGNRTAVDGHERTRTPVTVIVEGAGNHFLASAGLAKHQDGGIGIGDLRHHSPDSTHSATAPDQRTEQLGFGAALTGLSVLIGIDAGTMQGRQQRFLTQGPVEHRHCAKRLGNRRRNGSDKDQGNIGGALTQIPDTGLERRAILTRCMNDSTQPVDGYQFRSSGDNGLDTQKPEYRRTGLGPLRVGFYNKDAFAGDHGPVFLSDIRARV